MVTAIAGAVGVLCFFISIKDGGNADFYWKPMLIIWYVLTAIALGPFRNKADFAWLRDRWWLQLATPVVLLLFALLLVRVHRSR